MQTSLTSHNDVAPQSVLGGWTLWAVVLLLGLVGWGVAANMQSNTRAAYARSETAVARLDGNIQRLGVEAQLAAYGDAGALGRLSALRGQVQDDIGLLQRGGYLFNDDAVPVEAVNDQRAALNGVQSALTTFDQSSQVLLGASEPLRQSFAVERALPLTLAQISEQSTQLGQLPALNGGAWGAALNPLRQDLTRSDLSALPAIFAPSANKSLARQWADLLLSRATEVDKLVSLSTKDQTLSAKDKDTLAKWSKSVRTLASQADALSKTMDTRAQAKAALPALQEASAALENATDSAVSSIHRLRVKADGLSYVLAVCMGLAVVGLFGLLFAVWTMASSYANVRGGNARGSQLAHAAERLTRNMRRAVSAGMVDQDISEPADSPLFALASMINQVFALLTNGSTIVNEQHERLAHTASTTDGVIGKILAGQKDQQEALSSIHINTQSSAEDLVGLASALQSLSTQFGQLMEVAAQGSGVAKENVWVMDGVRENTQSTSKRIKRLGETTQNITTGVELVSEISRRVKVLALNMALEASSIGPSGRSFFALAQELERLAQNCDSAVKDIAGHIDTIQNDAKETVASMEKGTADVVTCARLSNEAENVFRKVEASVSPLREKTEEISNRVGEMSSVLGEELTHTATIFQEIQNQSDRIQQVKGAMGVFRDASSSLRKWLGSSTR